MSPGAIKYTENNVLRPDKTLCSLILSSASVESVNIPAQLPIEWEMRDRLEYVWP